MRFSVMGKGRSHFASDIVEFNKRMSQMETKKIQSRKDGRKKERKKESEKERNVQGRKEGRKERKKERKKVEEGWKK